PPPPPAGFPWAVYGADAGVRSRGRSSRREEWERRLALSVGAPHRMRALEVSFPRDVIGGSGSGEGKSPGAALARIHDAQVSGAPFNEVLRCPSECNDSCVKPWDQEEAEATAARQ
ncbi:unnamed protein product, partial [Urochloa humidicola]